MDHLTLLAYAEDELNGVITQLDETEMDLVTNCPPWTVRRLASHTLGCSWRVLERREGFPQSSRRCRASSAPVSNRRDVGS